MKKNFHGANDLFNQGKFLELAKGEVLHSPDENCKTLGRVEKGCIRFSRILSTGKEIVIKDFLPGDLFAELIVFTGEKYPGWLIAREPSCVVEVKLSCITDYLKDTEALVSYITGISHKMTHLSETIEILSIKTIRQKIAFVLLYRKQESFSDGRKVTHGYPHKTSQLAQYIGCSREAVSRALTGMEAEGIIKRINGIIKLKNINYLENLFC